MGPRLTKVAPSGRPHSGLAPAARTAYASAPPPRTHASPTAFLAGTMVAGKYLIEREIAAGGIGVVVAAIHVQLDQRVAIKYLQPRVLGSKTLVERFAREARLSGMIKSEHVVRVHDVGFLDDGGPFIVMEYLEGRDLGQVIQASGPMPVESAVDCILQACEALAEAHSLGIVHRDLKPENLFLVNRAGGSESLKILDFGISKIMPNRGAIGAGAVETSATERFGTPVYMSPEQLQSPAEVDARTDIWSLGVVLFELLTSTLPFEGDSMPQLCTSIVSGSPTPISRRRRDVPKEIGAAIVRCLQKQPDRRFRNVAELAQELAPFGSSTAPTRLAHIKSVIREGGDTVRPSLGAAPLDPVEAALALLRPGVRQSSVSIPASSQKTLPSSRFPKALSSEQTKISYRRRAHRHRWRNRIAVGGALLTLAMAIIAIALRMRQSRQSREPRDADAQSPNDLPTFRPLNLPSAPPPARPEELQASPPEAIAPPGASVAQVARALPKTGAQASATGAPPPVLRSAAIIASPKAAASSAKQPPSSTPTGHAPSDDYSAFGDRR